MPTSSKGGNEFRNLLGIQDPPTFQIFTLDRGGLAYRIQLCIHYYIQADPSAGRPYVLRTGFRRKLPGAIAATDGVWNGEGKGEGPPPGQGPAEEGGGR
jgi:hypothetical protein